MVQAQRFPVLVRCRMEQGEAGRFWVVVRAEQGPCQPLTGAPGCETTQPVEIQIIHNSTAYTQQDGEMSALPQQLAEAAIKPVLITGDGRGNVHLIERKEGCSSPGRLWGDRSQQVAGRFTLLHPRGGTAATPRTWGSCQPAPDRWVPVASGCGSV